jgi:hypothetical protein
LGEGEGAGVVDLIRSHDTISKGFVLTWDDDSIVRESVEGGRKRGRGGRREGKGRRGRGTPQRGRGERQ